MRILGYDELRFDKGIPYSRTQIWRLEKQGRFPKRMLLGSARHGWADHEIDEWIKSRLMARDETEAA